MWYSFGAAGCLFPGNKDQLLMGRPQSCSWGQHVEGAPTALAFRPLHMGLPGNVLVPLCSKKRHKRRTLLPCQHHPPLDPSFSQMPDPTAHLWTGLSDPISSRMS